MALGYCMDCHRLTAICPGSQKWGSRPVDWYPVVHNTAITHKDCGGTPVLADGAIDYHCDSCGDRVLESDIEGGELCLGDKKAIR
jgi:hypothetical protein